MDCVFTVLEEVNRFGVERRRSQSRNEKGLNHYRDLVVTQESTK